MTDSFSVVLCAFCSKLSQYFEPVVDLSKTWFVSKSEVPCARTSVVRRRVPRTSRGGQQLIFLIFSYDLIDISSNYNILNFQVDDAP